MVELAVKGRLDVLGPHGALRCATLATSIALAGSAVVALVHLAASLLERTRPGKLWPSLAVVGMLAVLPAVDQSAFLTSGDRISVNPWVPVVRLGFVIAIIVGLQILWIWHVLGVRPALWHPPRRIDRWLAARRAPIVWWVAGVGGFWLLASQLAFRFRHEVYFAEFLLPVAWLMLTTCAFRLAARSSAFMRGSAAAFGAVALLVVLDLSRRPMPLAERAQLLTYSRLAAIGEVAAVTGARNVPTFDVTSVDPSACAQRAPEPISAEIPIAPDKRRNVILITVDAVRPDVLELSVGDTPVAPNMKAFAARALSFTRAVTTYPATLFAIGGALTGLSPSQIVSAPSTPSNLFTLTRDHFDTQLAVIPLNLWFEMPIIDELFLQDVEVERRNAARRQTNYLISKLSTARKQEHRTFAWIHYYEPHMPYIFHDDFEFGEEAYSRYLGEVAYFDRYFGRLIKYLQRGRWFEDSLVIVAADHGQALGEHRYWGHHVFLDAWITDIPMYVRYPGVEPAESDAMVGIADIAPTVLHFLDLPVPPDVVGRSLFTVEPGTDRAVVAEAFSIRGAKLFRLGEQPLESLDDLIGRLDFVNAAKNHPPKVSITTAQRRLIVQRNNGIVHMFDRETDPLETRNLVDEEPEIYGSLLDQLDDWHADVSRHIYCRSAVADAASP